MRPEALREPTRKAAAVKGTSTCRTRLASGEKHGRKRMATLGTVYDADPAPAGPTMSSAPPSPSTPPIVMVMVVGGAARVRPPPASG